MENKIDFVITWLDGTDEEWQKSKELYLKTNDSKKVDTRNVRYRDIECLKYWFRAIEKYAPWVNHVYIVTCGHFPNWLNLNCDKVSLISHKDIIPEKYLPTFNSSMIELYLHKIPNISEQFVCFNDDMFITDYVKPEDFFKDNKPCDTMCLEPIFPRFKDGFHIKLSNMLYIINKNFNFNESLKYNWNKYINIKQGKYFFRNIKLINYNSFIGFHNFHIPVSHLKSTYEEVWNKERDVLIQTSELRFRDNYKSVNHWIFQYWNFASGRFYPRKSNFGKCVNLNDNRIIHFINKNKYKLLCINDCDDDFDFEKVKKDLISAFDKKLGKKSIFEK